MRRSTRASDFPRRVYTQSHVDYLVEAARLIFANMWVRCAGSAVWYI